MKTHLFESRLMFFMVMKQIELEEDLELVMALIDALSLLEPLDDKLHNLHQQLRPVILFDVALHILVLGGLEILLIFQDVVDHT